MHTGAAHTTLAEDLLQRTQIQLFVARRFVLDARWDLDLCSPFWRIYVHHGPGAFIRLGGRTLAMPARRIVVVPAWVRFTTGVDRPTVVQDYLHFQLTGFPPTLQRRLLPGPLILARDRLVHDLVERWQASLTGTRSTDLPAFLWAQALVMGVLGHHFQRLPAADRQHCLAWLSSAGEVQSAIECIDRRLADPPRNPELAALCGMANRRFLRRFRAIVGLSPARYGTERRLALAAQWLSTTDRGIEDLALTTGFTDRFHFTRSFAARFGHPPAEYRRMNRAR